jgi:hypothetical protein
MTNLKESPEQQTAERQRLHEMIQARGARAMKAVEYMLAHPLSLEEIDEQIAYNTTSSTNETNVQDTQ